MTTRAEARTSDDEKEEEEGDMKIAGEIYLFLREMTGLGGGDFKKYARCPRGLPTCVWRQHI